MFSLSIALLWIGAIILSEGVDWLFKQPPTDLSILGALFGIPAGIFILVGSVIWYMEGDPPTYSIDPILDRIGCFWLHGARPCWDAFSKL